ncbi:uncharacterized protein FFB20_10826 [Fusarium fujikuroi]|nr:uncharacterized protein FFE2_02597 [Fusarium fujikuroi]SCN99071.1 uncharacterized protein FFB20_10826 [Fusarium fujikuroi]SCO03899.1 uncharacterized protein FFC1_09475 [Fusarium fujikuroi]SCO35732.1 uncharacterized protein FFNC_04748 [Fusarium fujikuroi]SCV37440.1 uncharacterized protein FFFS_05662 [Fusarium fujikuroi]
MIRICRLSRSNGSPPPPNKTPTSLGIFECGSTSKPRTIHSSTSPPQDMIRICAQEPQEPRSKISNLINLTSRASQTTLEAEIAALPRRNPHQSSTSAENSARESLNGDGGMEELIDKEWGETPRP